MGYYVGFALGFVFFSGIVLLIFAVIAATIWDFV